MTTELQDATKIPGIDNGVLKRWHGKAVGEDGGRLNFSPRKELVKLWSSDGATTGLFPAVTEQQIFRDSPRQIRRYTRFAGGLTLFQTSGEPARILRRERPSGGDLFFPGFDKGLATRWFGSARADDGAKVAFGTDSGVTRIWLKQGAATGSFPSVIEEQVFTDTPTQSRRYTRFEGGLTIFRATGQPARLLLGGNGTFPDGIDAELAVRWFGTVVAENGEHLAFSAESDVAKAWLKFGRATGLYPTIAEGQVYKDAPHRQRHYARFDGGLTVLQATGQKARTLMLPHPKKVKPKDGGGADIVVIARQFIKTDTNPGVAYIWGAIPESNDDPWQTGWDCSGFTYWLDQRYGTGGFPTIAGYEEFAGHIPRGSHFQFDFAQKAGILFTEFDELIPGDVIFYDTGPDEGGGAELNHAGHVAVYIGDERVVQAENPGVGTIESSWEIPGAVFIGGMHMSWPQRPARNDPDPDQGDAHEIDGCPNVFASWDDVERWDDTIRQASEAKGVPINIIKSVMRLESNGIDLGINLAGAIGPMQVIVSLWDDIGYDLSDPEQNIFAGAHILRYFFDTYLQWANQHGVDPWVAAIRSYYAGNPESDAGDDPNQGGSGIAPSGYATCVFASKRVLDAND